MIRSADPAALFEPPADKRDVRRIGDLEIEDQVNRITLTSKVVLARDQAHLALAQDLRAMIVDVVQALEVDPALSEAVQVLSARMLRNSLLDQAPDDAVRPTQAAERTPGCPPAAWQAEPAGTAP
jgi:hypothetical protein